MKKRLIFTLLVLFITVPLIAQEGFLGEIRMFAGNYAPRGWARCDGQLLQISSNAALFSVLGVTYGGDGRVTFALPDLRGRAPIHAGNGPGLTPRMLGQYGGTEYVTLTEAQIPSHSHTVQINTDSTVATSDNPKNMIPARNAAATPQYGENTNSTMNSNVVSAGNTGGSQSHPNMQPFITINYIICIEGLYPPRN